MNRLNSVQGVTMSFTAVFQKVPEGYIGFVEELPGVNSQGDTLEEVRENLKEAIQLVLEANRQLAEEDLAGRDVIREEFPIAF
jgi:predicted RNase H-like HicB family nuclease